MSVGPHPEGPSGEDLMRLGTGIVAAFVVINFIANQPQTSYGLVLILAGIPLYFLFRKLNRT